ncbi:hypothetical protein BG011_001828 [Mortierella polycephala]|uniref:BAG domain-containing protein n=1 Tax=Mortierella polycephala TaxID=41804 RepID=A0A9P6Q6G3_9FUNG|nr:hypothetical protein BG011_001828 [Mortierella polycephala]
MAKSQGCHASDQVGAASKIAGYYRLSPFATHVSPQPALIDPFPSFVQHGISPVDDDTDEEELLLRAALERKRQQRAARHQYHQRQLEQQRLFELQQQQQQQQRQLEQQRYKNLLRQERTRQLAIAQERAQAQAQALYEAEQEAIRRYKREQWVKQQQRKQIAAFETFVLQPAHQEQEATYARTIAEAKKQERKRQIQAALEKEEEDEGEDEGNDLDPLSSLLEALFFPQQKRSQPQEETYPCKRRQQYYLLQQSKEKEQNHEQKKEQKQAEQAVKSKSQPESESKFKSKEEQDSMKQEQKSVASPYDDFYTALPSILEFVEAVFGGQPESSQDCSSSRNYKSESSGCPSKNKDATPAPKASETTAPTSSSCQLSPELKATNILRQRQQRQNQQTLTLQQKHSELNLIESALDGFSRDLVNAIEGIAIEENKKTVLNAEEGVSKAMFQIDSVESEGDLTVRQRRKELIRKSQDMLDKVDEFKNRETNTGKKVVRSTDKTESSAQSMSTQSSGSESENDVEPADIVDPLPEAEPIVDDVQEKGTVVETDNDEEEAVEPYTVAVSALSPSESETIQNDQEKDTQEEKKREDKTAKELASSAVEQPNDDYDIVPEF